MSDVEPVPAPTAKRQAAELSAARVVAAGLSALWLVVAARELAVREFGQLTLLLVLAVIAVQVADAGVSIRLPAEVARQPHRLAPLARRGMWLRGTWGVGASVGLVGAYAVATDGSLLAPVVFGVSVVATAAHNAAASAFRAVGSVRLEAVAEVLSRLAVAVAGAVVVLAGGGVVALAAVYGVADVAVALVFAAAIRRRSATPGPSDPTDRAGGDVEEEDGLAWRDRRALALTVPLATVYWRVDTWLLALLAGTREVALYGAAYRLLDAALLPALTIASLVAAPVAAAGPGEVWPTARRWTIGGAAVVAPFAVGSLLFAEPALRLLFGEPYEDAATMLRLLGVAAVASAVVLVATQAAAVVEPRRYGAGVVVALLASTAACVAFLGDGGGEAAAVITLSSQVGLAGYLLVVVRRSRASAGAPPSPTRTSPGRPRPG